MEAPLHVEVVKLRHYLCTGWGKLLFSNTMAEVKIFRCMTRVGKGRVGSGQGRKKGRVGSRSKSKVDPRVGP